MDQSMDQSQESERHLEWKPEMTAHSYTWHLQGPASTLGSTGHMNLGKVTNETQHTGGVWPHVTTSEAQML